MMIVITDGLNQDFMLSSSSLSSSTSNNGKIVEKSSNAVNSKVSRLRLLFLSDFNQNSIVSFSSLFVICCCLMSITSKKFI
jgi:hypothetical protein